MKKIISIVLALLMLVSFVGCASNTGNDTSDTQTVNEEVNTEPIIHEGTIPKGAIYVSGGMNEAGVHYYSDSIKIYKAGDQFPTAQIYDLYYFEDYLYCYGCQLDGYFKKDIEDFDIEDIIEGDGKFFEDSAFKTYETTDEKDIGWRVENIAKLGDKGKKVKKYSDILTTINGVQTTSLFKTFSDCSGLEVAPAIPNGVIDLSYTFSGCSSLKTAPVIPDSVVELRFAFNGCSSLKAAPNIPNNVEGMLATFENCTSIKNAPVIPEGVIRLSYAFSGCSSIEVAPAVPSTVETVEGLFKDCTNLKDISNFSLPSGVAVYSKIFSGCTSLVDASKFDFHTTNLTEAFAGCTALEKAPKISSVSTLNRMFEGCTSLTGEVEINEEEIDMEYSQDVFEGTVLPIKITGKTTYKQKLAETSSAGNVTY